MLNRVPKCNNIIVNGIGGGEQIPRGRCKGEIVNGRNGDIAAMYRYNAYYCYNNMLR